MDYLDFELKIGSGSSRDYPVTVVRSPGGEQSATMRFPFDELELSNRLQAVQIALLRSGGLHRGTRRRTSDSVQEFGKELFEALLVGEVRSCYRVSRNTALKQGMGLRVRLRIEAPELAILPWEFLFDASEGDYVCLSSETPVIRYLELDRPPAPLAIRLPLRILGVIASPNDLPRLEVEREKERMTSALDALIEAGLVELVWLDGQTWQDVQVAMRGGPWHVFHFVGHGGFNVDDNEGFIALAGEEGQTFRMAATKLARLLADHSSLRLVILNACSGAEGSGTDIFSSTASVLMRRGIPAVVAMQFEITDRAAIEFARVFYQFVAQGVPVDTSVTEARKAISMATGNTVEWGTPVLHLRAPDGRLFEVDQAVPLTESPSPPTKSPQPVEKNNSYQWLSARRSVIAVAIIGILTLSIWKFTSGPNPRDSFDHTLALALATEDYFRRDYSNATARLTAVARSLDISLADRRLALEFLTEVHLEAGHVESAQASLSDLLELEPPFIMIAPHEANTALGNLYDQERKKRISNPDEPPDPSSIETLAILPFQELHDLPTPGLGSGVSALLSNIIGSADLALRIVEREHLESLLAELDLGGENPRDATPQFDWSEFSWKDPLPTGPRPFVVLADIEAELPERLIKASHYLTGSVIVDGDSLNSGNRAMVSAWVFDVKTARLDAWAVEVGTVDKLVALVEKLGRQLVRQIQDASD